jgi:hypothetical protein
MRELKMLEEMITAGYCELNEFVREYEKLRKDNHIQDNFAKYVEFSYDIFEDETKY